MPWPTTYLRYVEHAAGLAVALARHRHVLHTQEHKCKMMPACAISVVHFAQCLSAHPVLVDASPAVPISCRCQELCMKLPNRPAITTHLLTWHQPHTSDAGAGQQAQHPHEPQHLWHTGLMSLTIRALQHNLCLGQNHPPGASTLAGRLSCSDGLLRTCSCSSYCLEPAPPSSIPREPSSRAEAPQLPLPLQSPARGDLLRDGCSQVAECW
jgi:hypothetical protein